MPLPTGAHQIKGQRNLIRLSNGRIVTRSTALSMEARRQGYSSEYERRKANQSADKVAFWKPRAIKAINRIDWEFMYVDDGDPNRLRMTDVRYDDIPPGYNPITPERVLAFGERIGYDKLTAAIREKEYIQDIWWRGDWETATERWEHRPEGLPDWFWWYHGIFH